MREPFCVSKKIWYPKFPRRRGWGSRLGLGGGHHGFVETFLSHSAEKFRVENFWYGKKIMVKRGGGSIAFFRQEFLSHSAEKLRAEPSFNDIEILVYRKIFMHNRGCHVFRRNRFVSVPKNFVGGHFGVSKSFGYREFLRIRR